MPTARTKPWTYLGLAIALVGIPLINSSFRILAPQPLADGLLVLRELLILALVGALLWIVTAREGQPISSIGLRFDRYGRSFARGVVLAIVLIAAAVATIAAFRQFGIRYGEDSKIASSLLVTTLAVVRAGIAEEVFYRGFAIERLQALMGSKWPAAAISLVIFAGFHFWQGIAGVVIAFVVGALLTAFYLWKRDLLAAIIAHFLVDFIPNVLLPLAGGAD